MTPVHPSDPFQDTIAAIATPPGEGGIGVVRVSGPRALDVACRVFAPSSGADPRGYASHTIHHGRVIDPDSRTAIDEALFLLMRAPRSYTGEEVVELQGHGGRVSLQAILNAVLKHGARPALPGEFSRRAFLNGRLDLAQAEAVLDVVRAKTEAGLKAAVRQLQGGLSEQVQGLRGDLLSVLGALEASIDFPEEGLDFPDVGELEKKIYRVEEALQVLLQKAKEGRLLREGATVVITGRPNVGKSSLLNALLGRERAIVSAFPGTTRDTVEEELQIGGAPIRLIDTAGLHDTPTDPVESEGVRRTRRALDQADLTIVVVDGSTQIDSGDLRAWGASQNPRVLVVNKSDLAAAQPPPTYEDYFGVPPLFTSALIGHGVEGLREEIGRLLAAEVDGEAIFMVGPRHQEAFERAKRQLSGARKALGEALPAELPALDVRGALEALGEIVGETATEELLDQVFRDFCIGK